MRVWVSYSLSLRSLLSSPSTTACASRRSLRFNQKARLILDRNLATHTYFSHILKPGIFEWSKPFRTKEYFDPAWMSSTYAIREIEKYFKSINSTPTYYLD